MARDSTGPAARISPSLGSPELRAQREFHTHMSLWISLTSVRSPGDSWQQADPKKPNLDPSKS